MRKIERVMDYEWLYERLDPYYNHEVGRPSTDPDCGMFVKGEHERQFAYEAHTACDRHGYVLGVDVTAGNVHDSVAWDDLYDGLCKKFFELKFVTMDAGYKTPWIAILAFLCGNTSLYKRMSWCSLTSRNGSRPKVRGPFSGRS